MLSEKTQALLPARAPDQWETEDGYQVAKEYAERPRDRLCCGDETDFEIANRVFMGRRDGLDLVGLQTAAKDRIRWLSVQLALTREAAKLARGALDGLMGDSDLDSDDSPEMKAMQALSAVLGDEP